MRLYCLRAILSRHAGCYTERLPSAGLAYSENWLCSLLLLSGSLLNCASLPILAYVLSAK